MPNEEILTLDELKDSLLGLASDRATYADLHNISVEFDRAIAKIKADAWDEGAREAQYGDSRRPLPVVLQGNPYRS